MVCCSYVMVHHLLYTVILAGDGNSIFIKNLPGNVTFILVEEAFKRFGPIKSGGIQIRNNKVRWNFWFGFT